MYAGDDTTADTDGDTVGFDVHAIFGGGRSRKKGKKDPEPRPAARHAKDPWEERPETSEPVVRTAVVAPMRTFVDRENAAEVSEQIHALLYTSFASFQHLMTQNISPSREISSGPGININIDLDL